MPSKKYPRDPNAPKRPTRPFIHYMKDVAQSVKEEMPSSTVDGLNTRPSVPKECARRWAAMASQDKEKYQELFREDSKRYEIAMKNYKPSVVFVEQKRLAKLHNSSVKKPDISTVPQMFRSYFDYVATTWAGVAASLPRLEPDQVQGEIWRRWCEGEPRGSVRQDENQNVVAGKKRKRRNRKTKMAEDTPRAPQLAYQLFQNNMKEELRKQLPDLSYNDIVRSLAAKWKMLTEEQKKPFFDLEREDRIRFETEVQEKLKNEKELRVELRAQIEDLKETAKNCPNISEVETEVSNDDLEIVEGMDEVNDSDSSSEIEKGEDVMKNIATKPQFTSSEEESSGVSDMENGQEEM